MKFCYIAPTEYIEPLGLEDSDTQLLLAHLVDTDPIYEDIFFQTRSHREVTILDNSAYELYREGKPMFDPEKMIELGNRVAADYLVLPDYPSEPAAKTLQAGEKYAKEFLKAGFGTFYVPQAEVGDLEGYIGNFAAAAVNPNFDYIGISILACPNAFAVDHLPFQRYLARWKIMNILNERGILDLAKSNGKRIHFLGMTDGPREIELVAPYIELGYIDTWDSSAPVWAGINGIRFDGTPTGLQNGKVPSAVNFNIPYDGKHTADIDHNIEYLAQLINYATN